MKLRYSPTSPYVRKVRVTVLEIGFEDQVEDIPTDVWAPGTDIGKDNPLGKVPALITDDGSVLFDSPVVCEYLDSLANASILPDSGSARWTALRQQALADGILDAAILRLLESRRPPEQQSEAWTTRQKAAIGRALDLLEGEAEMLEGPISIGQIAAGCALGYLDFRFGDDGWRNGRPKLAAWCETFSARPSMQATIPADPT